MTVVPLTSDFVIDRLNALPPHSRLRAGYCDLLREIRTFELKQDALSRECEEALEEALLNEDIQRTAGLAH